MKIYVYATPEPVEEATAEPTEEATEEPADEATPEATAGKFQTLYRGVLKAL